MQAIRSFALLSILLAGCASRPVPPSTTAPAPVTAARPAPAGDAPIRVILDTGLMRYQVESRTVLFAASDTMVPLDSVLVSAQLSLSARHLSTGSGIALSGTVEMLSVTAGLGTAKSSETLSGDFKLAWIVMADSIILAPQPTRSGCDQLQDTARDVLVSVFPPIPEALTRDQSWRAGSSLKSCRAGLLIDVSSRSRVQVVTGATPANQRLVTLRSQGMVSIGGGGTQGTSPVTLRGSGSITTTYMMDLTDGVLRSTTMQGTTQIEFDMGYRTDRLIQRTTRSITRVQ